MLHGHAVNVDMALSATLAAERGYITAGDRDRILGLMSRLGLAIDSPYLTPDAAADGDARRSRRPGTGGCEPRCRARSATCFFVNDLSSRTSSSACSALHRSCARAYPREGDGEDVFVAAATRPDARWPAPPAP